MNIKKVGIIFIVIGISAISSFLIYPFLSEKAEMAVPVLKNFSDSSISENDNTENTAEDNSEIWEDTADKPTTEISLPNNDPQPETASAVSFPIDINAATVEELMQIKGIGKATAESIVSYRENYGYFYSFEDLLNVYGIGDKTLDNIRDYIYISVELLPETAAAVRETVTTAVTSSVTVTTVPTSHSSVTVKQTSVRTTAASAAKTEDTDDGRIIEEITDFEDVSQTDKQSFTTKDKTTDNSFSDSETTSEEYYPNFPLELNTASAKDLAYIDGIGDTIAQRIVEYARRYGFYDVSDLLNVSGIGQSKLNGIIPYVYVDSSGLPPKTETAASYYDDIFGSGDNSYVFPNETTASAVPEIYRVNVNTAGKADFMQLPGIDEALADNIISLRSQIGGFATIEELSLAAGMTNSKLSAIWDYIYV
ncbi:MAG: helix-hairpin-helix domain-containing protein [Ruminococcus sp.]|nr:helix-hairpin-helix domain-containing protein [Ruminococcus sp.]